MISYQCPHCKHSNVVTEKSELVEYKLNESAIKISYTIDYFKCIVCSTEWISGEQSKKNFKRKDVVIKESTDLYKMRKWITQ